MLRRPGITRSPVTRYQAEGQVESWQDALLNEEPLTVLWESDQQREVLTSTMRTPGRDFELGAGLLFSESLIEGKEDLGQMRFCQNRRCPDTSDEHSHRLNDYSRLTISLKISAEMARRRLQRRPSQSLPQSACSLCSFEELASKEQLVSLARRSAPPRLQGWTPSSEDFAPMLRQMQFETALFAKTGAAHACAAFGPQGRLLALEEDVGRHNACDKALGVLLLQSTGGRFRLPVGAGLLFSSRLSFELAAKAVRAGATWMASVGAPTALAVELAGQCQLPLWGFVSQQRANRYGA